MKHPEPSSAEILAVGDLVDEFVRSQRWRCSAETTNALDAFAAWLISSGRLPTAAIENNFVPRSKLGCDDHA